MPFDAWSLVEELFGQPREADAIAAEPHETPVSERNALAHIAGRHICYPLDEAAVATWADGIVVGDEATKNGARVNVSAPRAVTEPNVVIIGCALGHGLPATRLKSRAGAGRFSCVSQRLDASGAYAITSTWLLAVQEVQYAL